jgi:hypothetical protein
MTPDQLRVFSKFTTDGSRNVENASCVLEQPSCEQSKSMDDALKELVEPIEQIRYRLVGSYARNFRSVLLGSSTIG